MTILAQDPQVRFGEGGPLAFAQVEVPAEILSHGPTGYRVRVVDYDASSQCLYKDLVAGRNEADDLGDPFARQAGESDAAYEDRLLRDPNFHSQNTYAIVMRTLARFEKALGRRVAWSFSDGHQLYVAPHAFALANAFYSELDKALFFGYFPGRQDKTIFTCLSHDVVAHETTHALLDGLRTRFTEASGADQGAFHEGFADIVALLSILSLPEIVAAALGAPSASRESGDPIRLIAADKVSERNLRDSALFGLAEQVGAEVQQIHGALRRSVNIDPDPALFASPEYEEVHARGELIAAAMMRSLVALWRGRIEGLGTFTKDGRDYYNLDMVVEEGVKAADHLLTMAIRALDYCPPTDLEFGTYLAALLTADAELVPDDRHGYRRTIRKTFESYGIFIPETGCIPESGVWCPFEAASPLEYTRTNFDSMLHDKEEVFRFVWENRAALGIGARSPIEVESVSSSMRQAPDGFFLRETIVTYVQVADIFGAAVETVLGCKRPPDMATTERIQAFGGGVLVFNQYGQVKYHIAHPLYDGPRQRRRLDYLMAHGGTGRQRLDRDRFAALHRARAES
jgi:hypothetical protein